MADTDEQILFERYGGRFVPVVARHDRTPDGVRYFSVEQVVAVAGGTAEGWQKEWRAWYPPGPPVRFFRLVGKQPVPVESHDPDAVDLAAVGERIGWTEAALSALHDTFFPPEGDGGDDDPPRPAPFVGNGTVAHAAAELEAAGYSAPVAHATAALLAVRDAGELLDECDQGSRKAYVNDAREQAVRRLNKADNHALNVIAELVVLDAVDVLAGRKGGRS